jgi:3-oxoacyl-[acyl-carrier-protein] synthase-3
MVDTTDAWIRERTGIRQRHVVAEGETCVDLAEAAARRALDAGGVAPDEIDLIVMATTTPDQTFPSSACLLQHRLDIHGCPAFDVQAVCTGFVYALSIADKFIRTGSARRALVVGAEAFSRIIDWTDRGTCVLFGDGAGAVVLSAAESGRGIMGTVMGSDGSLNELLNIPGGGSRMPATHQSIDDRMHFMKMTGREVFKHAVRCMSDAATTVLEQCGLTVEDVSCIIPHQANARIINAIASRLGTAADGKVYMNLERVGNMSAASVPVALDEAVRAGRIKRGDVVLFVVFGGGFTWGAAVLEW